MKAILMLLISLLLLLGCSKNNESTHDDNLIKLSSYSAHLFSGGECLIDVLPTESNLALWEEDPEIVTGGWENNGKSIRIKGENVGKTSIFINDLSRPGRSAEIKVVSEYFSGIFKEIGEKAEIRVQAGNKEIEKIIRNDLMAIVRSRSGTLYSFKKETNTVEIDYSEAESKKEKSIASYEWNNRLLTIKANENIDKYLFDSFDIDSVAITLDLYEVYNSQYPDAGVIGALVSLYLVRQ